MHKQKMAAKAKQREPLDGERSVNNYDYAVLGGTEKDYTNSREMYNFVSKQRLIPFDVKQSRITSKFRSTQPSVSVISTSTADGPGYNSTEVTGLRHIRKPLDTDCCQVMDKKVRFDTFSRGSLSNSEHTCDSLVDNETQSQKSPELDIKQSRREELSVRDKQIEFLTNQVKEDILRKYPKDYMSLITNSRNARNVETRTIKPNRHLANQNNDKYLDLLSPKLRSELAKRIFLKRNSTMINKSDLDKNAKRRQEYKPEISPEKVDYAHIQSKLKDYLSKSTLTGSRSTANQQKTKATDKQIHREVVPPLYISQPFQHNVVDNESSVSFDHMTSVSAPLDGAKPGHDLNKRPVEKLPTKEGTLPPVVNVSLPNESLNSKEICQVVLPELVPNLGHKRNVVVNSESSEEKEIPIQDGVGQSKEKQYDVVRQYDDTEKVDSKEKLYDMVRQYDSMEKVDSTSDATFDKNKEINNTEIRNSDSIDENSEVRCIEYVTAHVGIYRPLPNVKTLEVFSERQCKTKAKPTRFTHELRHPCFKYDVNWVPDDSTREKTPNDVEFLGVQSDVGRVLRNITVGSLNISNSASGFNVNNYNSMVPKTNRNIRKKQII